LTEGERDRLDLSGHDAHQAAMLAAGQDSDPATFRAALKAWERAGLETLESAGTGRCGVSVFASSAHTGITVVFWSAWRR
jgi:hypothetical protein